MSSHRRSLSNESHKHTVRHMLSGSFCKQISMVTVIWPYNVIQSDFWWMSGQGQVKVRSNFQLMFLRKKHMFLAQNFLGIKNMPFCFCTMRKTSENQKSRNAATIFSLYITNTFSCGTFVLLAVIVLWSRVSKKQFKHLWLIKTSRMIYRVLQINPTPEKKKTK